MHCSASECVLRDQPETCFEFNTFLVQDSELILHQRTALEQDSQAGLRGRHILNHTPLPAATASSRMPALVGDPDPANKSKSETPTYWIG